MFPLPKFTNALCFFDSVCKDTSFNFFILIVILFVSFLEVILFLTLHHMSFSFFPFIFAFVDLIIIIV